MEVDVLDQNGNFVEKMDLPDEIFNVKFNPDLVWQIVTSQAANKRKPIAHTKTRKEVRGGGRKPWPQKGLGRARHGSIRSPIFRKGGVVFGPRKEKVYKKKIPKKMKRKALFCVLSEKLRKKCLYLLNDLKVEKPKTKNMVEILKNLKIKDSTLVCLPKKDKNLVLASRNIPKLKTILVNNLNCLDLLNYKNLILTKEGVEKIKEIFSKK
jgi:large subunit ribosomal protein L4